MQIKREGEKFQVELTRSDIIVIISALGWADRLIPSDEAFQEYVGRSRDSFGSFVSELADAARSAF